MAWDEVVPIVKGFYPELPIIMTSAANTQELEKAILQHKVFYYHVKSFGNDELVLAVRNAVERHSQQEKNLNEYISPSFRTKGYPPWTIFDAVSSYLF